LLRRYAPRNDRVERAASALSCLTTTGELGKIELPPFTKSIDNFFNKILKIAPSNGIMRAIRRIWVGGQVYASEDCGSSHDGEPIIYRRANWALFLATVKSTLFLATPRCLEPGLFKKCSCPIYWAIRA
jgi:hypothetical protein